MKYWEIIADRLKKSRLELRLYPRVRMTRADSFGLWPQSVRTADGLLCVRMKS